MNILVISNAAWDDKNSSGNTYSNLFGGWEDATFHSMYSREQPPDNNCCSTYFCVSPFNLVKNILTPWRAGVEFSNKDVDRHEGSAQSEQYVKNEVGGVLKRVILLLIDLLYLSGFWLNKKTKDYIERCNPDIVMMTGISEAYRFVLSNYIKKNTKAKLITYIVDDTYNTEKNSGTFLGYLRSKRYKKLFRMSDKVYGISKEMCKAYEKEFGCKVSLLTKGCRLNTPKNYVNNPLQFVYAGNLLYGRDEVLSVIAKCLDDINRDSKKAELSIYTNTNITSKISKSLNIDGSSTLYSARPYDEIMGVMRRADVVLHVESFEPEQIKLVRYSFSTKITDCMQSGSAMMVIGPKGIASVEYPRKIDGVFVVDDLSLIGTTLREIVKDPHQIDKGANCLSEFAKRYHDLSVVRNKLHLDFQNIIAS